MAKKNSGLEFLETPEGLASELGREYGKAENFFERNRNLVFGLLGGLVLLVLGFLGYQYWQKSRNAEAAAALFPAVNEFEADSLNKALRGGPNMQGLAAIADDYGSTKAGKLADFYAGVALLKQGKYDQAIESLKNFSSDDLLVQARAYSLIGDAYLEKKDAAEAVSFYKKAADYKPNRYFTPGYLLKLGIAHEAAGEPQEAIKVYDSLLEKYPQAAEAATARRYRGMLVGAAGE